MSSTWSRGEDAAAQTAPPPPPPQYDPHTPQILHPPAAPAATTAAAARISSVAKHAAAAGLAAARDGVVKLQQQVQHAVASPAGAVPRGGGEITPNNDDDDQFDYDEDDALAAAAGVGRHGHRAAAHAALTGSHRLGVRLGSDTGLAGLADAAGHAWHDLGLLRTSWELRAQLVKITAGLLLTGTLGYAFLLAPNRLGMRTDLAMVGRCFHDNALAFVLFNLLGLFPFITNCLMWPALRSKGGRPAMWPHLVLSYVAGAFALLSYLVRWRPPSPRRTTKLPLARLAGDHVWLQRQHESRLMPAVVTASITALLGLCLAATPATWAHFGLLFRNSKAVHVMLIDLSLLTLMSPWLVVSDARARGVRFAHSTAGAVLLGLSMLAAPLVGPGVYLLLRPVTPAGGRGGAGFLSGLLCGRGGRRGGRRPAAAAGAVRLWLSQRLWPFSAAAARSAAAGASHQVRSGATAAGDRVMQGARQLRHTAAEAATASAAAAGAAAGHGASAVAAAAAVPLPTRLQQAESAAAGAAGFATGAAAGGLQRNWARFKRGLNRFFSGGCPQLATAARTGSADEVFVEYPGYDGATDSSDSTEHQQHNDNREQQQQQHVLPAHHALGRAAYFITCVTPGGGRELLFADDYNETEAMDLGDDDDDDSDDLVMGDGGTTDLSSDDGDEEEEEGAAAAGGMILHGGSEVMEEDEDDDITFDVAGGAGSGADGGVGEEEQEGGGGLEQQTPRRRGGYRVAKAVCLQRLAELAHFEHPRTA